MNNYHKTSMIWTNIIKIPDTMYITNMVFALSTDSFFFSIMTNLGVNNSHYDRNNVEYNCPKCSIPHNRMSFDIKMTYCIKWITIGKYHLTSNISRDKYRNLNASRLVLQLFSPIQWSQVFIFLIQRDRNEKCKICYQFLPYDIGNKYQTSSF